MIEQNNKIIGYISLLKSSQEKYKISEWGTFDKTTNSEVLTQLIRLKSRSLKKLYVITPIREAQDFFIQNGFVEVGAFTYERNFSCSK